MVKIQPSFKYSEFHVNYFTIPSLITTLSIDVTTRNIGRPRQKLVE